MQLHYERRPARIFVWICHCEPCSNGFHLVIGSLQRDSRLQAGVDAQIVRAPLLCHIRSKGQRNHNIIIIKTKFRGSHADNHIVLAIQLEGPSSYVAVTAKTLLPKMRRKDYSLVVSISPFFSRKCATDNSVQDR